MSLTTQRPNYVLVWIGIVMLTFSLVGQSFLDSGPVASPNSADFARFSKSKKDVANGFSSTASGSSLASAAAIAGEDAFDQLVPLRGEEIALEGISLTNHEISMGPEVWSPFSAEAVELELGGSKTGDPNGIYQGIISEGTHSNEPQKQLHAFNVRQVQESRLSRKQKAQNGSQGNGQYNSTAKGSSLKGLNRKKKGDSGPLVVVKSKFTSKPNGRVAVRFFLKHPNASDQAKNRVENLSEAENTRLARLAESYLAAMEEVVVNDHSNDDDLEQQAHKQLALQRIAQMKSKIREHIRQRPGGIELLAELSPNQLEALMQKLSAQNPKFRALVSS